MNEGHSKSKPRQNSFDCLTRQKKKISSLLYHNMAYLDDARENYQYLLLPKHPAKRNDQNRYLSVDSSTEFRGECGESKASMIRDCRLKDSSNRRYSLSFITVMVVLSVRLWCFQCFQSVQLKFAQRLHLGLVDYDRQQSCMV
jgi:hypothetical protein